MRFGIAAQLVNSHRQWARIHVFSGGDAKQVVLDTELSSSQPPLEPTKDGLGHEWDSFITRLCAVTRTCLDRQSPNSSHKLPVVVDLPDEYRDIRLPRFERDILAAGFGKQFKSVFDMAVHDIRNQFNRQLGAKVASCDLQVNSFEYRTRDTDDEPDAASDDRFLNVAEREVVEGFIRQFAIETAAEMQQRRGTELQHYGVMHWGHRDRPLYRKLDRDPKLNRLFCAELSKMTGIPVKLILSFPHLLKTDYVDDIVRTLLSTQLKEQKLASPKVQAVREFGIAASLDDEEYKFTVLVKDSTGKVNVDPSLSWVMAAGDLDQFITKVTASTLNVVSASREDQTAKKIPVYFIAKGNSKIKGLGTTPVSNQIVLQGLYPTIKDYLFQHGYSPEQSIVLNTDLSRPLFESGSLTERLTGAPGALQEASIRRNLSERYQLAKGGNQVALKSLVAIGRFIATSLAKEMQHRYPGQEFQSKIFSIGRTNNDWLPALLDLPEVRYGMAKEFIRILGLPYQPCDICIRLANGTEPDPIAIVQEQMNPTKNLAETKFGAPVVRRSSHKLKMTPSFGDGSVPVLRGAAISGFTDKLSFTVMAGHAPNDVQAVQDQGNIWKGFNDIENHLDTIADTLIKLARQQEIDSQKLGIGNYQIPLAIGFPANKLPPELKARLERLYKGVLQAEAPDQCMRNYDSVLIAAHLCCLLQKKGLDRIDTRFMFAPRGFDSVHEVNFEQVKETAEAIYEQFIPQIKQGWELYKQGKHHKAYKVFRDVTEECAHLYIFNLALLDIAPRFAMFGSTFEKDWLRTFKFLQLYDLKRVFESIVEEQLQDNHRFKLKLRGDKKNAQYSDPVRSHIIEAMHASGYLNKLFELPK